MVYDIVIIGGGVIGAFLARELAKYELDVLVIERNSDVGDETSSANSALIHSGYDPKPNTLKAKLNVLGNKMYDDIANELDVAFKRIGSITIAKSLEEVEILKSLMKRGEENGVPTSLIKGEELKALEPNLSKSVKAGLLATQCGIIDPFNLVVHAFENAVDNGVKLNLNEEVKNIKYYEKIYYITTNKQLIKSKIVLNCAGVNAGEIWGMIEECPYEIKPRKGQYYVLDHFGLGLVNHCIFPLPSNKGKGILITPTTSGNYLIGPSSEYVDKKEDVSTDSLTLLNIKEQVSNMIDNIPFNECIRVFAGNRSSIDEGDFILSPCSSFNTFINCLGIDSPGLSASPAIALYVIDKYIAPLIKLKKKNNFNPYVKKRIHPNKMDELEATKFIKDYPEYGRIICSCEKISLGELLDELNRSVPPMSIKAVKRRTRMGFGKCQGGFCQPLVSEILAKHYKIDFDKILYDNVCSSIVKKKIKVDKND